MLSKGGGGGQGEWSVSMSLARSMSIRSFIVTKGGLDLWVDRGRMDVKYHIKEN